MKAKKTEKRCVLVTGASSGIGRAVAKHLLDDGHHVIGLGRDFAKFGEQPKGFIPETIDFANLPQVPTQLREIQNRHPEIDCIVICAGRGQFGSLEEFSYAQIKELMDVNFTSQAYVLRALVPQLKQREQSNIIIIGSEAALSGARKGAIYCASKFALRGLAEALREECSKANVSVTMINPGMVKTEFYDQLSFSPGPEPENFLVPEDIADAVNMVLQMRAGSVVDEINLSPLKKVVAFNKTRRPE